MSQSFVHKKYVSVSQQIGSYWGNVLAWENNKKFNKDVEIDIILQKTNKKVFLFECKWNICLNFIKLFLHLINRYFLSRWI
ncbi:DUF234 domain-containing protein [Poinsettia branch-inducing phytoplasma]|uniref:DUF234 domain-containing protein n=1 Tax=Poinsettia branch-inducing phytoplasma TaxID=138647 RepID=UPI003CC7D6D6